MKAVAAFGPALVLLTAALHAQVPPPARPAGDAAMSVLAYVPPDADLAVCVRVDQLVRTDFWKRFADPKVGWYQEFVEDLQKEMAIDPEKDVAAAVLFFKLTYEEDGELDEPRIGFVLALSRDTQPETFFVKEDGRQPINVPGIPGPVHRPASDVLVAFPGPRTVVVAMPDWLPAALTAATTLYGTPPWPQRELAAPGEITFAGRMPAKLKAALRTEWGRERGRLLRPHTDLERVMEFALLHNLVALALDAETAAGSVNLADEAAALRATLTLREGRLASVTASAAQALADPLAMALPAMFGGMPLAEPPAEPLYTVQADGREIRVTMSRAGLEQLAAWMSAGAGGGQERASGAMRLRRIGAAALAYRADHGQYPATLAALTPDYLDDPAVLLNPALEEHLPDGDYQLVPLTNEAVTSGPPWARVLGYEVFPPGGTPAEGLYVLFADGHVERLAPAEFNLLYEQTLRSLGR
jgi:prepilin-type processing-associated H-X9-DG protein